jgi:hypothetical protein
MQNSPTTTVPSQSEDVTIPSKELQNPVALGPTRQKVGVWSIYSA